MKTVRPLPFHGVVVHYHEIGLKGRNRGYFERRLVDNLQRVLEGSVQGVEMMNGRLVVHTDGPAPSFVLQRIGCTFGVASYAPAIAVAAELGVLERTAVEMATARTFGSFAVAARRATKELPFTSRDINIALGSAVQAATGAAVDLSDPDLKLHVEVVGQRALMYADRFEGPGGLPVGVSGKVVSLLSGGIDSPVATYRILKRGAKAILCHFHSAPFTDTSSERKAEELARLIAAWQGPTTLYLVPLGNAQQQIVVSAPPDLRVVLYRRLMVRIAERIARSESAKALVTGDSLGQVASQTLANIACVDDVASLPVLRPLIGDDKQEIVSQAQRIGTYETSILPFEDCCSLFVPRSPATNASIESCRKAEADLDLEALVASCMQGADISRVTEGALRRTA
jgi:thiamine biosynthesis protein ThiI